jgi:hypothetical protein
MTLNQVHIVIWYDNCEAKESDIDLFLSTTSLLPEKLRKQQKIRQKMGH